MRINILNYYIKSSINFNNYYHFYGYFLSHIYILLTIASLVLQIYYCAMQN